MTSIASRADHGRVTRIAATMATVGRSSISTRPLTRYGFSPIRGTMPPVIPGSQVRYDALLGEWVGIAGHRQTRTYHPPANACPLCPSTAGNQSEIPSPDYDVVVFENRFPSFAGAGEVAADGGAFDTRPGQRPVRGGVLHLRPRRDAVRVAAVADADGHRRLGRPDRGDVRAPGVEQVFCFENRGVEIGVTLAHPHGQIYGYPFVTPKTAAAVRSAQATGRRPGANLFADVLAGELADGSRIVARERALGGVRAVRRPLARRGAPLPSAPGAGPDRAGRRRTRRLGRSCTWR